MRKFTAILLGAVLLGFAPSTGVAELRVLGGRDLSFGTGVWITPAPYRTTVYRINASYLPFSSDNTLFVDALYQFALIAMTGTNGYALVSNGDNTFRWAAGGAGGTGPAGPQGGEGPTGATGPTGTTGPAGATGPAGPTGSGHIIQDNGANVAQRVALNFAGSGVTITDNSAGGATNVVITAGSGPVGPQGPAGTTGDTGATGTTGTTGTQGPQGSVGPTGAQGTQGTQGIQGAVGTTGATGNTGNTGGTGPQGPQGNTGPQGTAGTNATPAGTTGQISVNGGDNTFHAIPGAGYNSGDNSVTFPGAVNIAQGAVGGTMTLKEAAANGTEYRAIKVPNSLSDNVTFLLPSAAPTAGQSWSFSAPVAGVSTLTWTTYEPTLGDPGVTGYVLSSTTGGARSWVAQSGGASPAGFDNQIQYKSGSGFAAIPGAGFNATDNSLTLPGMIKWNAGDLQAAFNVMNTGTYAPADNLIEQGDTYFDNSLKHYRWFRASDNTWVDQMNAGDNTAWDNITSRPTINSVTVTGAVLDNVSNYPATLQRTTQANTLSFGIDNVITSDDILLQRLVRAITITRVDCYASTDNVVGVLSECLTDNVASCTAVDSSDWTVTNATTGFSVDTGFENSGIAAGAWLKWVTTSVGTTNSNKLSCTIQYNE